MIDGGGRVLMPGMSDAHVHLVGNANSYIDMVMGSEAHIALNGLAEARNMLLRGFTAVRDMAGDTGSIKSVIDRGLFDGPRIYRPRPRSRRRPGTATSASSTNAPQPSVGISPRRTDRLHAGRRW